MNKNTKELYPGTDNLPGFERQLWKKFFLEKIKPLLNENHRLYFVDKNQEQRLEREKHVMKLLKCTELIMQLYHSDLKNAGIILPKLAENGLHFRIEQKKIVPIHTKSSPETEIFSGIIAELFSEKPKIK
jgi:hypothetical protein